MKLIVIFVALGAIVVAFALVTLMTIGTDLIRRPRGEDRGVTVIADSRLDLESDVGRSPSDP